MFKCFRDCAYLDLMEDRAAAEKTTNISYSYPRHSMGTGKSANRRQQGGGDEEEEKEDDYDGDSTYDDEYGDSEDEIYNTEDEGVDERSTHAPGPDELTGEYRKDNAAQQDNTPGMSQRMNRHTVSYVPQSSRRSGRRQVSPDSSKNAAVAASYGAPVSATAAAADTMGTPSVPNPEEDLKKCEGRTILARRTETDLAREATEKTTGAPSGRRTVLTCVNHVRQSQDRTTLYVIKSKGAMDYKLAYDDIVEVDEISSEGKVVLIAKDVEVHIAFKGRAASLKKFCTTLRSTMSASSPSKGNAVSSGNPYTSSK